MPAGRLRYVCALLLAAPVAGLAQTPAALIPPPVPTGAPLTPLPGQEAGRSIITADVLEAPATPFLDGRPAQTNPPQAGVYSTDCDFNSWCGDNVFSGGRSSFQVLLGGYFSGKPGPPIPSFDYVPLTFRQGWMLTNPSDDGLLRGNWEFLADVTVSAITSDYGHWFAGPSFYLRHNFVQPEAFLVPYAQLGAGFILNDLTGTNPRRPSAKFFEFYLHAEVGVKYFISKNWSVDLEGGLHTSRTRTRPAATTA